MGSMSPVNTKGSDRINERPSKNVHHGIRLAESLGFRLNQLVTINFAHTALPEKRTSQSFKLIRSSFTKWSRRPRKKDFLLSAPPTYVWVIENPSSSGNLHAHWAVHVPSGRLDDFKAHLDKWVAQFAGKVYSDKVIDVRPTHSGPLGLERYLLKGLHAPLCRKYGIRHKDQGFVYGKRVGHSENVGPVQRALWVSRGIHPRATNWRENKYGKQT